MAGNLVTVLVWLAAGAALLIAAVAVLRVWRSSYGSKSQGGAKPDDAPPSP